jgi:hypothetical protein
VVEAGRVGEVALGRRESQGTRLGQDGGWERVEGWRPGLLATSSTAKIVGGTSWKDMKGKIYKTRKCIEAINNCLHRLLSWNW